MSDAKNAVNCAVVGYGLYHDFGRMHCRWISASEELNLVGVCDIDEQARQRARGDFPDIQTYASVAEMVADDDVDMVSVVTPHFTHAEIVTECLRAGKHVIVEKAMATNVAECTQMIEAARAADRKLAVFHNRRHDGNYRAIEQVIRQGTIGEVFHIECCEENWGRPQEWWYSEERKSGGVFFYWGPHAVDWVLNLVPSKVARVAGATQRRLWSNVEIADEVRAYLWFQNGATAVITFSRIAAIRKPLWHILGTKGAIQDSKLGPCEGNYIPHYQELLIGDAGEGRIRVVTVEDDEKTERLVDYLASDWLTYYEDMAAAVLRDEPLPVTGEEGRMTVAVMQAAQQSGESGGTIIEMGDYQ